jgi:Protein of unknown function DUF2625
VPRQLDDLVSRTEPAIDLVREWMRAARSPVDLLPPSARRGEVLVGVQVTTGSPLGAIAYETGGVIIDTGWLRLLGSGHPQLARDLASWNEARAHGFFLVGDDAAGGFFALNGGAFGPDLHDAYYWPPDSLRWQALGMGYGDLVRWSLSSRMPKYYAHLRWPGWEAEVAALSTDRCFTFVPFLWTDGASAATSVRREMAVGEAFDLKLEILRQLSEGAAPEL